MRTHRLATIVATLSLGTLAACGPPSAPDSGGGDADAGTDLTVPEEKSGTITMLTKFAAPEYAPYFESVVEAYEAENPDVDIDLQQVGDQPYKDKIRVLSASNELPDIYFSWAGDFANKFVRADLAADLSSEIGPDTEWGSTFTPAALEAFTLDGATYGVPINLDAKYLAYNTTAFEEAGIDTPPATFEELLDACTKLDDAGYTPISMGNQYGWPAIHYLTQLNAYNVPAETLATDYDPASGEFTDPGYVAALEQFDELAQTCFNDGANGLSHEVAQANLMSGQAAMQYIEIVEFPNLMGEDVDPSFTENWSFFRLPQAEGASGSADMLTGAPDGFMVNANSENAGLALDFLKFMTNEQNATKLTTDIGWLSSVEGATERADETFPQLEEGLADIGEAESFAIWLDTVVDADVAAAYLAGVQGLLDGSASPQDVISDVQDAAAKAQEQVQ